MPNPAWPELVDVVLDGIDIIAGVRSSCFKCPVALAVGRTLRNHGHRFDDVAVTTSRSGMALTVHDDGHVVATYILPTWLSYKIVSYDKGHDLTTCKFTMSQT